jgi:YegS/Rv2252/BmrU family lipid kinase
MDITNVALLCNLNAGNRKNSSITSWIEQQLQIHKICFKTFTEIWPIELSGFSDIWIIGGDGTINYFINHYPHCPLPISIFKGGTGDDFAWKLYGNMPIEQQLKTILSAKPRLVDAGKFNDKLFINCLGIGFDGEVLQSMNAIRFIGGHLGYLLIVIRKIFTFKEYQFEISTADEQWNDNYLLLMVNNSTRTGGGFFISPDASIEDGQLNMVVCKKLSVFQRLKYLPVIEKGRHLKLPFIINRVLKKVTIKCSQELPVQVDGELQYASTLNIEVLPDQFLFRY